MQKIFIWRFNLFTQNTMSSPTMLIQFTFFQFLNHFLNKLLCQMLKLVLTVRNFNHKHFIINRVTYRNKPSFIKFTDVWSYLFHKLMANINVLTHFSAKQKNRHCRLKIFFSYSLVVNFIERIRF